MDAIAYFLRLNIRYAKNQACKFLLQIQLLYFGADQQKFSSFFKQSCYYLYQSFLIHKLLIDFEVLSR